MKKVLTIAVLAATLLTGINARADVAVFKNIKNLVPRNINVQEIEISCEAKLEAALDKKSDQEIEIKYLACQIGCHQTALAYGAEEGFSDAAFRNNCLHRCDTDKYLDALKQETDTKLNTDVRS